jgi:hypothetical protein
MLDFQLLELDNLVDRHPVQFRKITIKLFIFARVCETERIPVGENFITLGFASIGASKLI